VLEDIPVGSIEEMVYDIVVKNAFEE